MGWLDDINKDTLTSLRSDVDNLGAGQGQFLKSLNVAFSGSSSIALDGTFPYLVNTGIDHNLGYVPAFMVFAVSPNAADQYQQLPLINGGGTGIQSMISAYSTATQLVIVGQQFTAGPSATIPIKYYLFNEPSSV